MALQERCPRCKQANLCTGCADSCCPLCGYDPDEDVLNAAINKNSCDYIGKYTIDEVIE